MRKGLVIAGVAVLLIGLVIGVVPWRITTTRTDSETLYEDKYKWYYGGFWDLLDGDKIKVRFECEDLEDEVFVFIATESRWNAKKLEITLGETEVYKYGHSGTIEWECTEGGAYVLVVVPISVAWPVPYSIEMEKTSTYVELNYIGYAVAAVGGLLLVVGLVRKAPPPMPPPPPGKKYCPRCGVEMPVEASFCPKCGAAQ